MKLDKESPFEQYSVFKADDITVYLVYRSPNAPPEAMANLTNLIRTLKRNSILVGDFNLPDMDWETGVGGQRSRDFLEAVDDMMLEQLVFFPTHIKGNFLDLVLTNIPERVNEVPVMAMGRLGHSDHETKSIEVSTTGVAGRRQ